MPDVPLKPLAGRRLSRPWTLHKKPGPKPRKWVRRKRYTRRHLNRAMTPRQWKYCELRKKYPLAEKARLLRAVGYSVKTKSSVIEGARFFRETARDIDRQWRDYTRDMMRQAKTAIKARAAEWQDKQAARFGQKVVEQCLKSA